MDLGAVVAEARRHRQWTQAQLAGRAQVSRRWIGVLESGQAVRAELGRVLAVVAALDLQMTLAVPLPSSDCAAGTTTPSGQASDPLAGAIGVDREPWVDLDAHLTPFLLGGAPPDEP
jgi:transcriptional regulator with XRE-family HTH domain